MAEQLDENKIDTELEIEGVEREFPPNPDIPDVIETDEQDTKPTDDETDEYELKTTEAVKESSKESMPIFEEEEVVNTKGDPAKTQDEKKRLNFSLDKKSSILEKIKGDRKLLFLPLGVIVLAIVLFILFANGDDESQTMQKPQPKTNEQQQNTTQKQATTSHIPPIEQYKFDIGHINIKRLNAKLETLTKYELMGISEEEYLKQQQLEKIKKEKEAREEEKRKEQEAKLAEQKAKELEAQKIEQEKKALEEMKKAQLEKEKQEALEKSQKEIKKEDVAKVENDKNQESATDKQKSTATKEAEKEELSSNTFIKLIQIDTNKKVILKDYLSKINSIDKRVQACRDANNNIQVFVGPLDKIDDSASIINQLKKVDTISNILEIGLTKKEFEARCF